MNKEYQKIKNVFKFDTKFKNIIGINEPFKALKNIEFIGTEKVDGTNTRIYWDGHKVEICGRTDNSQWDKEVLQDLENIFLTKEFETLLEQIFENKHVILYGETYGRKTQKNGELYGDKRNFILFDVNVEGYDLSFDNVKDVASNLGLDVVSVVFSGNLEEAVEYVKQHNNSTISEKHEMEGIVIQPKIVLYDEKKNLIKGKIKYRDMVKVGIDNIPKIGEINE